MTAVRRGLEEAHLAAINNVVYAFGMVMGSADIEAAMS